LSSNTPQSPNGEDIPEIEGMYYGAKPELFIIAKKLRAKQTQTESLLWKKLINKQLLGYKFRRQHPINNYIADFYCHRLKFVIELDGKYHSSSTQYSYDIKRDEDMEEFGILVLRIKDNELLNDFDNTIKTIIAVIKIQADHLL